MWRSALAILLAAAAGSPGAPQIKDPLRPPAPVVGEWAGESVEKGGRASELKAGALRLSFTADGTCVHAAGGSEGAGRYGAGAAGDPGTIDLAPPGVPGDPWRGIYRVDGDALIVCLRTGPGDRPDSFQTGPGSGTVVLRLKRVKRPD